MGIYHTLCPLKGALLVSSNIAEHVTSRTGIATWYIYKTWKMYKSFDEPEEGEKHLPSYYDDIFLFPSIASSVIYIIIVIMTTFWS